MSERRTVGRHYWYEKVVNDLKACGERAEKAEARYEEAKRCWSGCIADLKVQEERAIAAEAEVTALRAEGDDLLAYYEATRMRPVNDTGKDLISRIEARRGGK